MASLYIFVVLVYSIVKGQECYQYENKLPMNLTEFEIAYYNETKCVYIFGGLSQSLYSSYLIYKWNTSDDNGWFETIKQTTPREVFYSLAGQNVAVIDNLVYFIGVGDNGELHSQNVYVFNMSSESFVDDLYIPNSKYPAVAGCVANNKTHIFLIGGIDSKYSDLGSVNPQDLVQYLQIYNIKRKMWTQQQLSLTQVQSGWAYQSCSVSKSKLYIFGGTNRNQYIDDVVEYDTITGDMYIIAHLPSTLNGTGGIALYSSKYDSIYYVTPGSGAVPTGKIYVFDVAEGSITGTASINTTVSDSGVLILNDKIFIFGGDNNRSAFDIVQVCNLPLITPQTVFLTKNKLDIGWIIGFAVCACFLIIVIGCWWKDRKKLENKEQLEQLVEQYRIQYGAIGGH